MQPQFGWVRAVVCIGGALLLTAAIIPANKLHFKFRSVAAIVGSLAVLVPYGYYLWLRVGLRLGWLHARGRLIGMSYQPNVFDRVMLVLNLPVSVLLCALALVCFLVSTIRLFRGAMMHGQRHA